jgi:hypothetical protein
MNTKIIFLHCMASGSHLLGKYEHKNYFIEMYRPQESFIENV